MTKVGFYLLPEGAAADSLVAIVCRLCDKLTSVGRPVYLRCDAAQTEALDGALWSFRQGSFIAHERYHGQPIQDPQPMVLFGESEPPVTHENTLINLGNDVPVFFSRFESVMEFVEGDATRRAQSRKRYKFYKDRGYELNTFEQNAEGQWKQRGK